MAECERCGLIIGLGCACNLTPASPRRPYEGRYRWIRFGPDALLIFSYHVAHIPGACHDVTEENVLNQDLGWGWIPDPDPVPWDRISPGHPVQATAGNIARMARTRCPNCARALGF